MTCETCKEQITIHADGSAYCSCDDRSYGDSRPWPDGWREGARVEELQAREILDGVLTDESDQLKDFVFEHVDERDVLRQAHGRPGRAVEICRAAMESALAR